jgi:hypothetical protein
MADRIRFICTPFSFDFALQRDVTFRAEYLPIKAALQAADVAQRNVVPN